MRRKIEKSQVHETVDAETLAAIDEGLKLAESGKRWTMEEAFDYARKRRKEWMTKPSEQHSA